MHSRWLFAFGIGTGMLLSGLVAGSQRVAFGAALTSDKGLESASVATEPHRLPDPSRFSSPRADQVAKAPRANRQAVGALPLPDDDDDGDSAARDAARRDIEAAFQRASGEARDEAWARAMEQSLGVALDRVVAVAPVAV